MDVKFQGLMPVDEPIVYVREVHVTELPDALRLGLGGVEKLYAVHAATGERLALTRDRALAFVLARQHNFTPVTVH